MNKYIKVKNKNFPIGDMDMKPYLEFDRNISNLDYPENDEFYDISFNDKKFLIKSDLPKKKGALDNYTWDDISTISQLGLADKYFNIGDSKTIILNGRIGNNFTANNMELKVFILDINVPEGNTKDNNIIFGGFRNKNDIDIALQSSDYGITNYSTGGRITFNMNHTGQTTSSSRHGYYGSNYGGWKGTDFRYDILGTVETPPSEYNTYKETYSRGYDATYNAITNPVPNTLMAALPSDFRNKLRLWKRYVDCTGGSTIENNGLTYCIDAGISLFNYVELFGTSIHWGEDSRTNKAEKSYNKRFSYYKDWPESGVNSNMATSNNKIYRFAYSNTNRNNPIYYWTSTPYGLGNAYFVQSIYGSLQGGGSFTFSYTTASTVIALAPIFKI